jgi:hypothetical protein
MRKVSQETDERETTLQKHTEIMVRELYATEDERENRLHKHKRITGKETIKRNRR